MPYGLCLVGLMLSSVRYPRVEAARVAADPARPIQVRHNRGSFQQIYLLVRCLLSLGSFRFSLIDRYPELREFELRQLARELLSSDLSHTLGPLKGKIKSYTDGQLPHAEHILPALYKLMESDESVKGTPLPALEPSSEQGATGGD